MAPTPDDSSHAAGAVSERPARIPRRFLVAMGTAAFGAAIGFLAITAASSQAGAPGRAGLYTALVTSAVALGSLVGTAATPRLSRRGGSLRVVRVLQVLAAVGLALGGVALILGLPVMPVLMLVAIPVGLANGTEVVLRAPFARLLVGGTSTSQAYARLGVVSGVAFAAGAAVAGLLLNRVSLGFGLLANSALLIPLILLLRMDPELMPPAPPVRRGVWASMRESFGASTSIRLAALTTVVAALLLLPSDCGGVRARRSPRCSPSHRPAGSCCSSGSSARCRCHRHSCC